MARSKRNHFAAPKKLKDGSVGDLRDYCESFKMVAENEEDMKFLSHLYTTIWVTGGSVIINDGSKKIEYNF